MTDFDVCIIGSGAGGAPIAYELSQAGKSVVVLEKGPWFKTEDFTKDEIACCRRSVYTPNLSNELHVIEEQNSHGEWVAESTFDSGRDFWNGNMVGGSSNLMSGYFHRLKPEDFRLLTEFGPIKGANIVDWPITYEELEPYYTKVENIGGVSGKVVKHTYLEPRSTADFPFSKTAEHPITKYIDNACQKLGYTSLPTPRAILSQNALNRKACSYSNYCGSYGCATDAKGSARAALLNPALKTGNCKIIPQAMVYKLVSDNSGKVVGAQYFDINGNSQTVSAKIFVVACQASESARLLLLSTGPKHPNGLANDNGQVGKNLIYSGGGSGTGDILYKKFSKSEIAQLKIRGLFVNRSLQDWYIINDKKFGKRAKGGTIDFLFRHANPISRANSQKWGDNGLLWGRPLQSKIKSYFSDSRHLRYEVFNDWLPTDNCFATLDPKIKDKWGNAVARIRVGYHQHDLKVGRYLAEKAVNVLKKMGAENISMEISGSPPPNLVAGGCRFGKNPQNSVLNPDCRTHDVKNLYVTDASFMPTGGSVPYTWTIYANSFRVADKIQNAL